MELLADDNSGSFTRSSEVYDFINRTLRIDRNTTRAGLEYAKISHAPFRRVVTNKHHAIASLDTLAGKKTGRARRQFTHVGIRVLLVPPIAFNSHGDTRSMAFCRGLE